MNFQDGDDEEVEDVDSDEWDEDDFGDEEDAIAPNDCFFCVHHSSNMEKNMLHMSEKHSFFVPDLEYVVNLDGLLSYLGKFVIINFKSAKYLFPG